MWAVAASVLYLNSQLNRSCSFDHSSGVAITLTTLFAPKPMHFHF